MRKEGVAALVAFASDHNVCSTCKELAEATRSARARLALHQLGGSKTTVVGGVVRDGASGVDVAKLQAEVAACEAAAIAHEEEVLSHNKFVKGLELAAEVQARKALRSGNWVCVPHGLEIDDKTSAELPSVPLDTSERAAFTHNIQGIIDVAQQVAYVSSTEIGAGSKDAHSEIDQELLYRLTTHRGQRFALTIRDCARLGLNAECTAAAPMMYCDHKIYDAYASVFWKQRHGKCYADCLFGTLQQLMVMFPLFSMDQLLDLARKIMWQGSAVEARALNPMAMTDWAPYFLGQCTIPFPPAVEFSRKDPHILVYFGAHITTATAAAAIFPEGVFRDFFSKHWKGPGYLSMQQYENSPIEWIYVGVEKPKYVAPLARVRLQSEDEKWKQVWPTAS